MSPEIVILGAGESGTGAAILAQAKSLAVFVSDKGAIAESYKQELQARNIAFEENGHSEERILKAIEIIKSPGISPNIPLISKAVEKGIPIIDELEFAFRYNQAKCIAITGSNGKTTTTLLTYHLMQKCGFRVGLAGNVGKSFARQVATENFDWYVLEVSSFQLDGMHRFKAEIGILTNITPDHLDRYDYKFENYIGSKFRIAQNMGPGQKLIFNAFDQVVNTKLKHHPVKAGLVPVGLEAGQDNNIFSVKGSLVFNHCDTSFTIPQSSIPLKGEHNMLNAMMAVTAVSLAGGNLDKIKEGIRDFVNAPHRCEPVGKIKGVVFVNDSKATNVDSVKYAFSAFSGPIVWIAGGIDKGNDYTELDEAVEKKVSALICLGKDNGKLKAHFKTKISTIKESQSVSETVKTALDLAPVGSTVLLSPACASFDLFKNYEDRGNQFRTAVQELEKEIANQTSKAL
jgi:UDP-N-acetylmuramoylalanine--D-glutamate ligase